MAHYCQRHEDARLRYAERCRIECWLFSGAQGYCRNSVDEDSQYWFVSKNSPLFLLTVMLSVSVISWIASPLLSGLFASIFYLIIKFTIMHAADPFEAALVAVPIFFWFTLAVNLFGVFFNGSKCKCWKNFRTSKTKTCCRFEFRQNSMVGRIVA